MSAEVTHTGVFDMQICVPKDWTDEEAEKFANQENPCGTSHGWCVRRDGDAALAGADERVVCEDRKDFVHIMLDA